MATITDWATNPMGTLFNSMASGGNSGVVAGLEHTAANHQYLTALGTAATVYETTGSVTEALAAAYGAHEVATGDASTLEKGMLAWVAGDMAEAVVAKAGGGWLSQVFAGWATTIGVYLAGGKVSDDIEAGQEVKAIAPARSPGSGPG
jgi:hypothetical protein